MIPPTSRYYISFTKCVLMLTLLSFLPISQTDKFFAFDAAQYKGVEVIDLR